MNRKFFEWIMRKFKNWFRQSSANFVTAIGLLISFWLIFTIYYQPERLRLILVLWLVGGLTDYIDGKIARRFNIESMIGSIIDRIRDKTLIYPALFVLAWRYRWKLMSLPFPSITTPLTKGAMVVIFILEGLLLIAFFIGGIWYLKGTKINFSPNEWGGKKMFCSFIVVLIWLVSLTVEKDWGVSLINFTIFPIYLGFLLIIYWGIKSLVDYCKNAILKSEESEI